MTQKELAGDKYSAAYISTVEAERRTPSTDAFAYFADRLGVSTQELITGQPTELPVDLLIALVEAELAGDATAYPGIRSRAAAHGLARIEAEAAIAMGDLAAAGKLLENEPITVRVGLVLAAARAGTPNEAAYLLENALSRLDLDGMPDPEVEVELRCGLVSAYAALGMTERAAEQAEVAGALSGGDASTEVVQRYLRTARTLRDQARWADAEAAAERARAACRRRARRDATATGAWAKGRLRLRAGDAAGAVAHLTEAHGVLGAPVAGELAEALWRAGRTAEAVLIVDEADPAIACRIRGLIARDAGDLSAAERELRVALDAATGLDTCTIARELGDILRSVGQEFEAIEVYRRGLAAAERSVEVGMPRADLAAGGAAPSAVGIVSREA